MSVCNFKIASDQPLSQPFTDRRTVQRRFGNRTVRRLLHRPPTFTAAVLFLLVLSGPPRFRARDPEASLRGDIDWVVMVHVVVWVAAGLWVLTQVGKRFRGKSPLLRLRPPAFLGMAMILWLAASTGVSDSPALTLFKAYQMLVSMLFVHIFVQQSGAKTSLRAVFLGNTLLSIAITCCAFFAPDLVWRWSDFNPDPSRLSGDLIAPTGVVAALGIILLLTSIKKMWRVLPMCLLALFFGLLALSLMRTAYVVVFLFFALALLKRPRVKFLRHIVYLTCALGLLLVAYDLGPHLSKYRDPGSISSLSDRVGLWRHLADVTMHRSPWLGLGYYAASRIYGPEYNPGLGTAHSMFFETLLGGGIPSFFMLTTLCFTLSIYAIRLLWAANDRLSFAVSTLFLACLAFGFMESEIDSGPVAITFWYCVAVLPRLWEKSANRTSSFAKRREVSWLNTSTQCQS